MPDCFVRLFFLQIQRDITALLWTHAEKPERKGNIMGKLTKTGIAIALGLTFSLSMFTGAFAQSAQQSAANSVVAAAVTTSSLQGVDQGHDNWWQSNQGHGNQWQG